ncbi:2EXR domain-containing protein [Aspergillus tanneri]|uniref:2EXR domain-containing protein n=1 Tax=Aspergillus tanneri TaxID=1220188 RepID=A0A5M9N279_9EURO|nr:uncharacterized protein ATNIH1004_003782 [Aspergillus tanneri]KAA8651089.1 hypothetical protein ATNIH1004_003782 [Aspergillus tanneri]
MPSIFTLFSSLPTEIRLNIWHLSVLDDRVIYVSCDRHVHPNSGKRYVHCFRASLINPAQLQVNHEARNVAKRLYLPLFRTEYAPHRCIYLSPEYDIVRLDESLLAYLDETEQATLCWLSIDVRDYKSFCSYTMRSLCGMKQLKEVVFVIFPLMSCQPHRLSNQLEIEHGDIVIMLKDALMEYARDSGGWTVPRVKVESYEGKILGVITINTEDVK